MKDHQCIRVLLLEDNPTDAMLLRETFSDTPGVEFAVTHVERLAEGLDKLGTHSFDAILVDLSLPDSQGVETFLALQRRARGVPILVLTALDDDSTGLAAMREGAQDFLVKRTPHSPLLNRSIRFAIERVRAQQATEQSRSLEANERELRSMDEWAAVSNTAITARLYASGSLREGAPEQFDRAVAEYADLLVCFLRERVFKVEKRSTEALRALGDHLGFLRARPRDVVEIHTAAMKRRLEHEPIAKAQALIEEGRLAVLELMGHLTSYYRNYYHFGPADRKDPPK